MKLFIVESPTKARTVQGYLGKGYRVIATMGHIKDLPAGKMGFDFDSLEPNYVFLPGKRRLSSKIIKLSKVSQEIFLGSDKDREGEVISFHVKEMVKKYAKNIYRVEFDEITKDSIKNALQNPRDININFVNAQKARRLLDRIIGYTLSPEVRKGLRDNLKGIKDSRDLKNVSISVGRVQSAALKIVCDREREIMNFKPQRYYEVSIVCKKEEKDFELRLIAELDENCEKKFFTPSNRVDERKLSMIKRNVNLSSLLVDHVSQYKEFVSPLPPFKTSTLQQDASSKLGFSISETMRIAQDLYEGMDIGNEIVGLITYMRTDSVRVSEYAMKRAREFLLTCYPNAIPERYRVYSNSQSSQDAHECIRPTDVFRTPELLKMKISPKHLKLYELIWRRFLASQMRDAILGIIEVSATDGKYFFFLKSKAVIEKNFFLLYPHSVPEDVFLPLLSIGEKLDVKSLKVQEKETQPPQRYTEATLIKKMEQDGIGRPSTYATIVLTLIKRKYVIKYGKSLKPTELGFLVCNFLEKKYPKVVDIGFTSYMESKLDEIEEGTVRDWKILLIDMLKTSGTYKLLEGFIGF